MKLPSEAEIEALHRKYAASEAAYQSVHTHCKIVWEIAETLIRTNNLAVDADLVRVGCMLHDIGIYRFEDRKHVDDLEYLRHGIYGYEILKSEGLPKVICRFAKHHTGVGLTKTEIIANSLPLPHEDMLAETPEERLVMYADAFNSKNPPRFTSFDTYRSRIARFGETKANAFDALAKEFGKPDLAPFASHYNQPLRA